MGSKIRRYVSSYAPVVDNRCTMSEPSLLHASKSGGGEEVNSIFLLLTLHWPN